MKTILISIITILITIGSISCNTNGVEPAAPPVRVSPERARLAHAVYLDTLSLLAPVNIDMIAGSAGLDTLTADAWMLVDDATGMVVSARNACKRRYMASLTKMMTALLALEHGRLADTITITEDVYVNRNSYVRPGESYVAHDLMHLLMMMSDNDAAHAIAKAVAGDTLQFYGMMNRKAQYLAMNGTHYANPNGMPNNNNYSCAADLVKLVRYCTRDSLFAAIVGTQEKNVTLTDGRYRACYNTNRLLGSYDGCSGVKTGFTRQAGFCLAATATRDGTTLALVLLNCPSSDGRFAESAALLDYGFNVMSAYRSGRWPASRPAWQIGHSR